jgi:hypothetical protein
VAVGTAVAVSGGSRGVAEASRPQPVTSPSGPQPAVAEARQAPATAEARPKAPVAVAQPVMSAVEVRPAPAAAEAQLEAAVAAARREPAATVAQQGAAAVEQQGPSFTGSSRAMVVEIPDDEVPPLGWGQWASLLTSAPEPQAGALVRRCDGHMVAASSGHGAEASSSRAGRLAPSDPAASPGQGQERVDAPPLTSPTRKRSNICGRSSAATTLRSTGC